MTPALDRARSAKLALAAGAAAASAPAMIDPKSAYPLVAEILVPAGTKPGEVFRVVIADGRELTIRCPTDATAGDVLEIDLPPTVRAQAEPDSPVPSAPVEMETAEVAIPSGLQAGESFSVKASWGGVFQVEVPRGTVPGSTLFVEYPKHPPAPSPSGTHAARQEAGKAQVQLTI